VCAAKEIRAVAAPAAMVRAILLASSVVGFAAEPLFSQGPAKPATRWLEIEAATGAVNLDGTLRLNFKLGDTPELKALGLPVELRHGLETDPYGRARSVWQVRGLQSSLVPFGRERLRWRSLSGESSEFERAKIGRAFGVAGASRWLIRETVGGGHEIRAGDGRTWRFRNGLPVGVEDPALGAFDFLTQGALIREIRPAGGFGPATPLVVAVYDEAGQILSLKIGAGGEQRFQWTNGELKSWQRPDGEWVHFTYRDNLLTTVAEPARPLRTLAWEENAGHLRGDSRWAAPAHLAADGAANYDYTLSSAGFTSRRRPQVGGEVVTIFNPRRRRLEQYVGEEKWVVTFRGGAIGRGALEKSRPVQERFWKLTVTTTVANSSAYRAMANPSLLCATMKVAV
jgi:hypothetical protein